MPILHCKNCHHEWESPHSKEFCDWCGSDSYMIKEMTELEKATHKLLKEIREELKEEY